MEEIQIPGELAEQILYQAVLEEVTVEEIVTHAIRKFIEKEGEIRCRQME